MRSLVEEHDAAGVHPDVVDRQPALFETDVSRRRTDQTRDRVLSMQAARRRVNSLPS
jgi:hypothetical protein